MRYRATLRNFERRAPKFRPPIRVTWMGEELCIIPGGYGEVGKTDHQKKTAVLTPDRDPEAKRPDGGEPCEQSDKPHPNKKLRS